jgi:hypothetical protein
MQIDDKRRQMLKGIGLGLAVAGAGGMLSARDAAAASAMPGPSLIPEGAKTLQELTAQLAKATYRRDFKTVPMILTKPDEWDAAALDAVLAYKGSAKQVWDNTDLGSPWLNLMRNAMNAQVWSFRHPDFLCVSATHGTAHLAIYDEAMWDKYGFTKLTGGKFARNVFIEEPKAAQQSSADFEAPNGVFSPADNSIAVLQRRGAVFMACHNAIWEFSGHLIAVGSNPDHAAHEALAAELTNHLIPGIVLTPGAVGTLVELQRVGFTYAK